MAQSTFICNFARGKRKNIMHIQHFSETTLRHLKPQQGLSERHQRRSLDLTLACKLTLMYAKYHLVMLHRELFMNEEKASYQLVERMAGMMC